MSITSKIDFKHVKEVYRLEQQLIEKNRSVINWKQYFETIINELNELMLFLSNNTPSEYLVIKNMTYNEIEQLVKFKQKHNEKV